MIEYWNYYENFKVYSENPEFIKKMLELKQVNPGANYYDSKLKLIGRDFIVSKSKIDFIIRQAKNLNIKPVKIN